MISRFPVLRMWPLAAFALGAFALPGATAQSAVSSMPPASAEAPLAATAAIGQSLHLVVGRSMFINTRERLRRVYVSDPTVLDSMTASPRQIVVTAKAPGVTTLVLWDETGATESYQITADLDVISLRQAIHSALPNQDIHVEGRQDQVVLSGSVTSQAMMDQAVKLAGLYSKSVANALTLDAPEVPQVKLKVRVVEIDRSKVSSLGFNFFTVGANTSGVSTGQYPAVTTNGGSSSSSSSSSSGGTGGLLAVENLLNLFYYNDRLGVGAAIQALENKQILQILAEPTLTALSGHSASFLSGGEFPFPVIQGSSSGFTSVTIQFRPYGVKLDFTPTVLPNGVIQLKVAPEVSALDYTNAVEISGYTIPAIDTRRAQTVVQLRDGQSFMISGLLDNRTTDLLQKVPGIGDIPILGKLFQSKSVNHSVEELAVIVTPTIVNPITGNLPAPVPPKMVVPFLNEHKFDSHMSAVPKGAPAQQPAGTLPQ